MKDIFRYVEKLQQKSLVSRSLNSTTQAKEEEKKLEDDNQVIQYKTARDESTNENVKDDSDDDTDEDDK
jgi:hypothetical protein